MAAKWRSRLKRLLGTRTLAASDRDRVLFTFDDGPHPEGTVLVLDALRRHGARAVFFVVGSRVHRAPELLQRILDEGHVLGNHSYTHDREAMSGLARYRADLQRCQDIVESSTGFRPTLFRPPLGEITMGSALASRTLGLRSVFWSVDSDDWRMRHEDDVIPRVAGLDEALAGRGLREIVLMHDERLYTAMLLDRILPGLVDRGIDVRTGADTM